MKLSRWAMCQATLAACLLAACTAASSAGAPTHTPGAVALPTAAPVTPAPLTRAPATAGPTVATAAEPLTAAAPRAPVTLRLWHAYDAGGAEELALGQLVAQYTRDHPGVTVNVQRIPGYQLVNRWQAEVASGGGADLFIGPNDLLGEWVRAKTVAPLDDLLAGKLEGVSQIGLDGMTVDGRLYGVPGVARVVALYYNRQAIAVPPANTDEVLSLVNSGKRLVLAESNYYLYGFFEAFGGQLMDAAGRCTADLGGFAEAMQYLLDLKAAGAKFVAGGDQADALFETGAADMTLDGPWVLREMTKALGGNLGVASMPAGPQGPARPLTSLDGFYVNPNSHNQAAAVDLGLAIFSARGLALLADTAGDAPARADVTVADPLVKVFAEAAAGGRPRPQSKAFNNWWGPFGVMVNQVIGGAQTPPNAIEAACRDMNKANNK